jgi:hypothetical protein
MMKFNEKFEASIKAKLKWYDLNTRFKNKIKG